MRKTSHKLIRFGFRFVVGLVIVISLALLYFAGAISISEPRIKDRRVELLQVTTPAPGFKKLGPNWLKQSESGLWEMYLEGDGFERGVINGKLTKELASLQETVFISQIRKLIPSERYLDFLKYFVAYFNRHVPDHISEEYKNEIYGVSLSAADKFDRLAPKYYRIANYHSAHDIGHALQDKNMTVGCTSFGVWDAKTTDGKLLIGRNFDFFAGDAFAENKIVCFVRPSQGNKFMFITWAGFTGVVSGMNDRGLTVTINASKSEIPKSAATPIALLAKEILQYAGTIEEAYVIAQKRQTFVSESILIGCAQSRSAAVIEKTPGKTGLYPGKDGQIICVNHFKGPAFADDYINNKNILESSSLYRNFRMEQLLRQTNQFSPVEAAKVLRDQRGLNNRPLGLTNEKGINQLIAHHSVIFKPEEGLVWVSTTPYQLGKYVCYDLNRVFREAPALTENREIQEPARSIPADPFLYSAEFRQFLLFKQLRYYIEFCTKSDYGLTVESRYLQAFETSNPESYLTFWVLGNYYARKKNTEMALHFYQVALSKEVATQKEKEAIALMVLKLNKIKI